MHRLVFKVSAIALALQIPLGVNAQIGHLASEVTRLVNQPGFWGGCAARMIPDITTTAGLEGCNPNYVTFDCDGTTGVLTKSQSTVMFSNAQLSMVAGYRYYVKVDPTVMLNGVCLAVRSDALP